MIVLTCGLVTLAVLVYVFYLPGTLSLGPRKTRLTFLRERKDVVYDNLRDLNFEYKAGKLSDGDYISLKTGLEEEAANLLLEISRLEGASPGSNAGQGTRI